ncbi:hypothetical protein JCM2811A_24440 [Methylorubrum rhodinum]
MRPPPAQIRQAVIDLAGRGAAILVISQDLDELFEIADAIAVLHAGTLSAPVPTGRTSRAAVGLLMGGADEPGADTVALPARAAIREAAHAP